MLARSTTHLVLIPSYNTGFKLVETVRDALAVWSPVWVVVDGSGDGSEKAVEALLPEQGNNLRIIRLAQNEGKGAAVLHVVNEALAQGFTHVLTMDADGQHSPAHVAPFMAASQRQPDAVILGLPQFDESAPLIRLRGRRLANLCAGIVTLRGGIGDCLYGFRVYPAAGLKAVMEQTRRARRFDFDPEVAVRLVWRGHPPVNVPAPCRYLSAGEGGISHFNYYRDNALLSWMFNRLFVGAVLRSPVLLYRKFFGAKPLPLVAAPSTDHIQLAAQDRVLFLAPHPDDESLAGGALLQRAAVAGAAVRVLFATNGDNNPWPQRFVDRRWSVGSDERKCWGARRRQEARDALCVLGLSESAGEFLGFPDQGFTSALLRADTKVIDTFTSALSDWKPTLLILPSPHDIHPDHNAIAVIFDIAMRRLPASLRPRVLHFLVHPHGTNAAHADVTLRLTDTELRRKRRAILCHETQMALSRKRFLRYAATVEHYLSSAWSRVTSHAHPITDIVMEKGALCVKLKTRWHLAAPRLLVVAENVLHESVRWEIPMRKKTSVARMSECVTGRPMRLVTFRRSQGTMEVRIPLAPLQPLACIFVKLERRLSFYDQAGWMRVSLKDDSVQSSAQAAMPAEEVRIQTN